MDREDALLSVRDLRVGFATDHGPVTAVDGISFDVPRGGILGIVGESGSGKSVTAHTLLRLLPQPMGRVLGGSVRFDGRDLLEIPDEAMHKVRAREIGMIFQEPMSSLNPVHRIARQLGEVFLTHLDISRDEARQRSIDMLRKVGIPAPEARADEYPHQLSGGMRQRVGIAMAMALNPKLLIADEPTTALDVTVQAQILDLLRQLQSQSRSSIILITHDLGVIAEICQEVCVMYAGRIVERASVRDIFRNPLHAYTRSLMNCIPGFNRERKTPLATIEGLVPSLAELKPGCRFAPRSGRPYTERDLMERPPFVEVSPGHWVEASRACVDADVLAQGGVR